MRLLPLLLICACPGTTPVDSGDPGGGGAPACDEATLYDEGYDLGEQCIDWITVWDESDGQCAADALALGYSAARTDSGEDCDQSSAKAGVAPSP